MEEKTILLGFQFYAVHNLLPTIKKERKKAHRAPFKRAPFLCNQNHIIGKVHMGYRPLQNGASEMERMAASQFLKCDHVTIVVVVTLPNIHSKPHESP